MKQIKVNGISMDWDENMTIQTILNKKNFTFKMLVVKVNGELVRKKDYDTTTVPENAEVKVIHLISGG